MLHRAIPAFAATLIAATPAVAQDTDIAFALDWRFEGPSAPYFLAIDNGYFAEEGMNVEVTAGQGSLDAIPKVATGAFPFGFADINSLISFLDQNPGAPVTAIFMTYDSPPFSIVGRVSQGISGIEDLEGSVLGAPPPDGAWAQFPILAAVNDIDVSTITVEPVGFPTREPMLAEGNVDAVTGFNFSSYLSALRLGVPAEDLTTIMYSDHGVALYGNALIVNTDFAEENPEMVTGFITAVARGWADAIADPAAGVASVIERNPAGDAALEQQRLELAIEGNVLTDYVIENGMGNIDPDRMATALEQLALTYEFQNEPDASLYFTDAYLPEGDVLMVAP
ncbi:ABC-type nitrate/sulfonate/bicarbonate transport system, periplasmic component [Roseibacterium elongatum DSM 19469]|uniref:ABC-type nitrate/sulfonate/bicarbonate transport system, periplasmic component n=1 Tax=Roseicyclus elongatus DSM 19469 TaxID=1294273 RepID=W8RYZ6_9RHOB|nr:ABC-type nitrate/sulfonate/bicarbonate transport system, periplasmic component [Roseibacterium elongatum DSM 19469]